MSLQQSPQQVPPSEKAVTSGSLEEPRTRSKAFMATVLRNVALHCSSVSRMLEGGSDCDLHGALEILEKACHDLRDHST